MTPWLRLAAAGLLTLALAGCSSTPPAHQLVMTGDLMVDGPNAIAQGPPRDKVLWQYRTAAAAMRQGNFALAKENLDDALTTLQGIYAKSADARKARSYFHAESKKNFIGEPYERSMAYIYRGILYWMDGQPDNARACFRTAEFEDSDTENKEYAGDWVLPDYLDGYASAKLAGDGEDALKRAQTAAKNITLPPYNLKANVLFFLEFGPGPTKFASGQYAEQLRFHGPDSPVKSAQIKIESLTIPVVPTDDVTFQATTRGGRVMDHILGNKAVFKGTTDTIGNVAMIGGLGTAVASHDRTTQQVGLGIALAGLIAKGISAATTPAADTRSWDNLPHYISFASVPLSPGQHTVTVEFLDQSARIVQNLTKTVTLTVDSESHDKVVFLSDTSLTPQTL